MSWLHEVYEYNRALIDGLAKASTVTDELLEFCETRECPACPFWPCHGDFFNHVFYGPGLTIRSDDTRESISCAELRRSTE